jgi:hypothetical protein
MMKRSPSPVPNSSPPPTTPMGSKVSPPKQPSGENQGDKPGGEKQIERKLSQFSEDKRGEKTNQTASEKQVEAPKPPGGEKKCEKPKLSSVEKQVEKPKQPGGEKQGDKAKQLPAFTDPANKITAEQRAVRARGSATPKREQQGAKDTYGSLLMSRAKGRIADELLIQYDVYLEKYREYSSCMQIFQFLRTRNAEAHSPWRAKHLSLDTNLNCGMLQAIFIARTPLFHDAFEGQCGQLGTSFRRTFGTRYATCTVFKIRPAHTFIILFVRLCTFAF